MLEGKDFVDKFHLASRGNEELGQGGLNQTLAKVAFLGALATGWETWVSEKFSKQQAFDTCPRLRSAGPVGRT